MTLTRARLRARRPQPAARSPQPAARSPQWGTGTGSGRANRRARSRPRLALIRKWERVNDGKRSVNARTRCVRGGGGGLRKRRRAPTLSIPERAAPGRFLPMPEDKERDKVVQFYQVLTEMSFEEFAQYFSRLELVHLGPDDWMREPALRARRPWRAVLARRRWRRGYNAGGPPDAKETTGCNPQFHVQIPGAGAGGAGAKCHVVVSVTQQYAPRGAAGRRLRGIGFALYELPAGGPGAGPGPPGPGRALDVTHWSRAREVATFFTLPPGEYLLVPHTRRAHVEAAFLLRVLTDQHANIWCVPPPPLPPACAPPPPHHALTSGVLCREVNEDNMIVRSIADEFPDEHRPLPVRPLACTMC
ncbi:hypothetical protein MSG28_012914 [Choristoneura fumiferana]|uniref:Uncharacterized protein n=1 Tax=Choristoneura fumiferana TaxID=7141 RepID=A0ACC0KRB5_CHOFU|nr:hypothetical protein MSG28_012914 [Choristoneura fumiferana]